jgi:serine protease
MSEKAFTGPAAPAAGRKQHCRQRLLSWCTAHGLGLHWLPVSLLAAGLWTAAFSASAAPTAPVAPAAARTAAATLQAEVIVGFKAQADTVRRFALAARATPADGMVVLSQRAQALGKRLARPLQAGPAVGAHAQVVRATGVDAATLARQLAADPEVAFAVPNGRKRITTAPNDPLYAEVAAGVRANGPDSGQWYLRAPTSTVVSSINVEAAWARTRGSASVVVAVLDTGVRFDHPDLGRAANGGVLLPGYDFVSDTMVANDGDGRDADPSDPGDWLTGQESFPPSFGFCGVSDSSWHGTSTASLVAAATDNAIGMAGAAPGVRVLPVRVLGRCGGSDADIQAAMLWAAGISQPGVPDNPNPARVINMSLGGVGTCDASYQSVVGQVLERGVSIVAAAGNGAGGPVGVPANCPGVVGVTALRHAGTKVGFSDLGPEVSISAPGGNCINITTDLPCIYPILAATNTGKQGPVGSAWTDSYNITVGTSFATPLVAAVAGLMVSQRPALLPAEVRSALRATARAFPTTGGDNGPGDATPVTQCRAPQSNVSQLQCYCTTALCGAGMLDAGAAVAAVSGPVARLEVSPAAPTAGQTVTLVGTNSMAGNGSAPTRFDWSLVSGGGVVTGFSSATNAATATLVPSAAGSFTVRLTVTDSAGASASATTTVVVDAAPTPPFTPPVTPPVTPPATSSGGGGGGAASWLWVLGVLLAVALLHTWCAPVARQGRTAPR